MGYIEETEDLKLDFNKIASITGQAVLPVAIQNADTNEVILVAYTNQEALLASIRLRRLVLWSPREMNFGIKGKHQETSLNFWRLLVNCEQNSLVYKVRPLNGNICHTSYKGVANNCFYRRLDMDSMKLININKEQEKNVICKIYETGFLKEYKFVVVLSKYQGKLLLSRHKQRTTWETQGGHLEAGETPLEAAKRELYEESGAIEYDIAPLCDYWAGEPEETSKIDGSGMVFVADIYKLGTIPPSEMAEVCTFEKLPENLTYPDIVPVLYARAQQEQKIIY